MKRPLLAVLASLVGLAACSAEGGAVAPFRQSCEKTAAWQRAPQSTCLSCLVQARLEVCECRPGEPAAGACLDLSRRRTQVCGADGGECTLLCQDCECLERCQTSAACADAAAQLEACPVRTCEARCQ